ncbi:Zn-dependent alcohol dehydrogenase [Paraburkholderia oxyphila]|uniref:Zn-dependent alcohol dehydrogenase n=1 Tax=Paraburkholderia oxyphila TaxID=614212 RepID=UPI000483ABED|nr:Zn-dependent alcohol dehydrogenase [Paraburkholderia oxyphila]
MKAAVLNRISGGFQIEEVEIDDPIGREVLVSVRAAGLCHSDLHLAQSDYGIPLPAVLGHELAGIVEKVGSEVTEFKVGDHVVGTLVQFCGHCSPCLVGHTWQCDHPEKTLRAPGERGRLARSSHELTQVFGVGAFAEYSLVHENQLVKIPVDVPFAQASVLGCGTITGVGAVFNTAGVRPGETVAVIGAGGVGLNVIAGASLAGAGRIIAIDAQAKKEALARDFGATDFVNASKVDAVDAVLAASPAGVDHAFEAIGLKQTLQQAVQMVRKGGAMYVIGLPKPGTELAVEVHPDLIRRQVTIKGVYMGSTNIKHDIPMYAEFYRQGRLDLDRLVSRQISIYEINDAYRALESGEFARSVITSF